MIFYLTMTLFRESVPFVYKCVSHRHLLYTFSRFVDTRMKSLQHLWRLQFPTGGMSFFLVLLISLPSPSFSLFLLSFSPSLALIIVVNDWLLVCLLSLGFPGGNSRHMIMIGAQGLLLVSWQLYLLCCRWCSTPHISNTTCKHLQELVSIHVFSNFH